METKHLPFDSFDAFYQSLNSQHNFTARFADTPGMEDQIKSLVEKLYVRSQEDTDFQRDLISDPQETALAFLKTELTQLELTPEQLEAVAGGEITTDTSLGYDIGYVIGSAVEWVRDLFN